MRLASDVAEERAQRGRRGRRNEARAAQPREHPPRCYVSRPRALDVPFDAGDLSGAVDVRPRLQGSVQRDRERPIEEGVAMDLAEPHPLGLLQPRDAASEDALLLGPGEPRLESDQVPRRAREVLAAQLHNSVRPGAGARVGEPHRLHRAVGEHVAAALGHHLDGQAAFEVARLLERVRRDLLPAQELVDEPFVLFAGERQVEVVRALALAVARLREGDALVHRVARHDGRDGVVEGELRIAHRIPQRLRQRLSGQRPGGDDAEVRPLRQLADFFVRQKHQRMRLHARGQPAAELHPIDRQRIARRHARPVRRGGARWRCADCPTAANSSTPARRARPPCGQASACQASVRAAPRARPRRRGGAPPPSPRGRRRRCALRSACGACSSTPRAAPQAGATARLLQTGTLSLCSLCSAAAPAARGRDSSLR